MTLTPDINCSVFLFILIQTPTSHDISRNIKKNERFKLRRLRLRWICTHQHMWNVQNKY